MDIVRRAYLQVFEDENHSGAIEVFHLSMIEEMKRWIKLRVYSPRDWPREFGPLPIELKPKRGGGR